MGEAHAGWAHPRLDGRVMLVTGGAKRVGRAIVEALAAEGAMVAVHHHRSEEDAAALVARLEEAGGTAVALRADLLDPASAPDLVEAVVVRFGRLDGLVNSASIFGPSTFESTDLEALHRMLAIHVEAPFELTRAALPWLRADGGSVVNIVDAMLERPRPGLAAYTASKAALVSLTRSLAIDLAPEVRVNAVAPGAVLMQAWEDARGTIDQVPQGRAATSEEIAAAVHLLIAGPAHITGHVLTVDGGWSLHR